MRLRALRRDRAARIGPELFLLERVFEDCLERIALIDRRFGRALLIGCPDAGWPERLRQIADDVDACDPGPMFAEAAGGEPIIEDAWEPQAQTYDVILAIATLDTVNDLPRALWLIRRTMSPDALFIGAVTGGDTLPQLRSAMRAADALSGGLAARVHPRIEAAAFSHLLAEAGFAKPVVDVDRIEVSYPSLARLISDLRAMGATNVLRSRPPALTRQQWAAAAATFADAGNGRRTAERFEILHFAAWTPTNG